MERSRKHCCLLGLVLALLASTAAGAQESSDQSLLPFIVLHGVGDQCRNEGVAKFTQVLSDISGATGYCISVGNGRRDSYFMRIDKQAELVCNKVKSMSELQDGYNIVGLSQGNMIARAVIEWCHGGPPVHNYVSLGGPHAGIAAVPLCTLRRNTTYVGQPQFHPVVGAQPSRFIYAQCEGGGFVESLQHTYINKGLRHEKIVEELLNKVMGLVIYTPYVQDHLAPSGYFKIPTELRKYYLGAKFLPKCNNEIPYSRNELFRKRFSSLNHLVLVMFDEDLILVPPQTAWFGYYAENEFGSRILAPNETKLYKEDWIGLRSLNENGRVTFLTFPGNHLSISDVQMQEYIVPYLAQPSELSLKQVWKNITSVI